MVKITDKIEVPQQRRQAIEKNVAGLEDYKKEIEKNLKKEVTELLEAIMVGAICLSASDVHLEPKEEDIRIRVRLDGMLHDVLFFSKDIYHLLLSRIKLLAGLKLNIHDKPQDGSFSISLPARIATPARMTRDSVSGGRSVAGGPQKEVKGKEIEIRTSALPADFGESIVMRILNPESLRSIEELGLRKDLLELFKNEIKKPNGMIIITGPTGSGKTTTLYAFLQYLQKPEIKIITIEDPIEYRLSGISQTEVDARKGYDFANGLRSIVRQDPDVILVGEVRDLETAEISLQAALTGHLVFSTLHTNDAAGAVPRLTSLGAKVVNIGPAINMVVAQRLVRKVCKKCAATRQPTSEEMEKINNALNSIPKDILPVLSRHNIVVAKPKGCQDCHFTGYKGRVGIFEAFLMTDEIESLILKTPSIPEIKKIILRNAMLTMYQDGIIKALGHTTTIEEVERVASE